MLIFRYSLLIFKQLCHRIIFLTPIVYILENKNLGEITCLPLSRYHFSFLPPQKRHFQKYLLH